MKLKNLTVMLVIMAMLLSQMTAFSTVASAAEVNVDTDVTDADIVEYAKTNGYSTILWSVDSLDWKSRNASAINRMVTQHITNGSIVLMHDIHAATADALPQLIQTLQTEGYQFATVSELLSIGSESSNGVYF